MRGDHIIEMNHLRRAAEKRKVSGWDSYNVSKKLTQNTRAMEVRGVPSVRERNRRNAEGRAQEGPSQTF